MAYIGNEPGVGTFIVSTERFNGTGACTQFTITQTGIDDANAIDVIVNSVVQDPINSYSITDGVITFTEAPSSGTDNIIVRYRATTVITFSSITSSQILDGAITASKIASGVLPSAAANSAGVYANAAFATANTGTASGSYANSAFAAANTATASGSYANSAFTVANNSLGIDTTQNTNITSASSYANSGFAVANSAASYANASFSKANSVVTSAVAGTGVSVSAATGAVTFTNSGVTSIVAGSGISISGATGAVTVTASGGGVTSLNGQTGAITETSLGVIGSVLMAIMYKTSTGMVSGETIAGSSLYYPTSVASWASMFSVTTIQSLSAGQGMFASPKDNYAQRTSNGNTGVQTPSGNVTTLSGTWRCMSSLVPQSTSERVACDTQTTTTYGIGLFVRVS